jgi:hypothetical protein
MKFKVITSLLTSLIITFVIYIFSKSYILKNYSSTIEFRLNHEIFNALLSNFEKEKKDKDLNKILTEIIKNYLNKIFIDDIERNYHTNYMLINNNDSCKLQTKFNKLPISITIKELEFNDHRYYNLKISYLLSDPTKIKICNNEINTLINDKIREEISYHLKSAQNFLSWHYDNENFKFDDSLKSYEYLSLEERDFIYLNKYIKRIERASNLLKQSDYLLIKKTISNENEISQSKNFIYFFLIFIFLLVLIYSTLSGITKKYYKKINKYINY